MSESESTKADGFARRAHECTSSRRLPCLQFPCFSSSGWVSLSSNYGLLSSVHSSLLCFCSSLQVVVHADIFLALPVLSALFTHTAKTWTVFIVAVAFPLIKFPNCMATAIKK